MQISTQTLCKLLVTVMLALATVNLHLSSKVLARYHNQ